MLDTNALVRLIVREDPVNVEKAEAFTVPLSGGETTSVNTTVIRNAAWIAAWDGGGHRYFRDGDVAFAGNRIVHVGGPYEGPADRSIDGSRRFVMPGLVNVHSHPHTEPAFKGVREDYGVPEMYDTGLYERSCAFSLDAADRAVRDVFVDGRPAVENGKPLHLDPNRAADELEESQARMLADAPRRDFLSVAGDAITPYSLPL